MHHCCASSVLVTPRPRLSAPTRDCSTSSFSMRCGQPDAVRKQRSNHLPSIWDSVHSAVPGQMTGVRGGASDHSLLTPPVAAVFQAFGGTDGVERSAFHFSPCHCLYCCLSEIIQARTSRCALALAWRSSLLPWTGGATACIASCFAD